jgi:hypothetical protein
VHAETTQDASTTFSPKGKGGRFNERADPRGPPGIGPEEVRPPLGEDAPRTGGIAAEPAPRVHVEADRNPLPGKVDDAAPIAAMHML